MRLSARRRYRIGLIGCVAVLLASANEPASAQCYPGLGNCAAEPAPAEPASPEPEAPPASASTPEEAPRRSFWDHNGSIMSLTADGDKRQFYYEEPRRGIRAVGVSQGTLLFDGRRNGALYSGTAFIFSPDCGPVPYDVRGAVSNGERRVTMRGKAPSRFNDRCQITAYKDDVLVFDFVRAE
jgi:hypothetical protein